MLLNMLEDLKDSITEKDRGVLLRFINRAYKELYDTYDIPNSIFDEYFEVDGTDGQIALPEYVDQIRGAGAQVERVPLRIADFRSGYRVTPQFQHPYEWRVRTTVPLGHQMDATDQLRVELQGAEAQTVNVYITGKTASASSLTETVTFEPGETVKITDAQFLGSDPYGITAITKDTATTNDVIVYVNTTNTEISRLRNKTLRSLYTIIQVNDMIPPGNTFVPPIAGARIVYKRQFVPLHDDTDELIYQKLEDAVVWKARELWFGSQLGQEAQASALYAYNKVQALVNTIVINQESESEKRVTFARNPYEGAWRNIRRYRYGQYYTV